MTRSSSVVVVDGLEGNEEKLLRKLSHTSLNEYSGGGAGALERLEDETKCILN